MRAHSFIWPVMLMLGAVPPLPAHAADSESQSRARLQQQQLEDALELNRIQSGTRSNADLTNRDALKLDQLQLRQRLELQQLENDQLARQRLAPRSDPAARMQLERQFSLERQMQLQRFDSEQRNLLRSMPQPPLQRVQPPGQLILP